MSKKLKLSPWHSGNVKPVHVGVYEREFPNAAYQANYYTYFDGNVWHSNSLTPSGAMKYEGQSFLQFQRWRGILK